LFSRPERRAFVPRALLCALAAIVLPLVSCPAAGAAGFSRYTQAYFGTVSILRLNTQDGAEEVWARVKDLLGRIDRAVSVSIPGSDIAAYNSLGAGEGLIVSDITADIYQKAREAYSLTGGLYDPTVYPLVDLWGFSPRFNTSAYRPTEPYDRKKADGSPVPPDPAWVSALLPLVGMDKTALTRTADGWLLKKLAPSVTVNGREYAAMMDLGGVAKGYACDRVRALLLEAGYKEGCFICGDSSVVCLGGVGGTPYTVSVKDPRGAPGAAKDIAALPLENEALATSSDAAHYYMADGVRYCHIIDPRTGCPINTPDGDRAQRGVIQATVTGQDAALLDALGTAVCVSGSVPGEGFLEGLIGRYVLVTWRSDTGQTEVLDGTITQGGTDQ